MPNKYIKRLTEGAGGLRLRYVEINEDKTGKVIVPVIFPKLNTEGRPPARRISLPSSIRIATFPIVFCHPNSKQVKLADEANAIVLLPGQYIVIVKVMVSEKRVSAKLRFTVHTDGYLHF